MGIDFGGTKLEAAVVKIRGDSFLSGTQVPHLEDVLARRRVASEIERGPGPFLFKLKKLVLDVLAESSLDISDISAIGIGAPGSVRPSSKLSEQVMLNAGSATQFLNLPLGSALKEALNFKGQIKVTNDANCFVLAEAAYGAASDFDLNVATGVGLIIGTGVGGGVIVQGKVLEGRDGGAGEVGHLPLYDPGLPCPCGVGGHPEGLLAGPSIERRFFEKSGVSLSGEEIFRQKGQLFEELIKEYRADLVRFLLALSNTFNPHYFVFGGGVSLQDEIYANLENEVAEKSFLASVFKENPVPILKAKLGDSSGVIGAAVFALS